MEYRFTVYTPGFIAATVYPEGVYNVPDPTWGPSLLRVHGYGPGIYRDTDAGGLLESRSEQNGERVFIVKMRRLSGATVRSTDLYSFYSQLTSLDEAISRGFLRAVGDEDRRTLARAARLQYDSFASRETASDNSGLTCWDPRFAERTRPLYERVQSWGSPLNR